MPKTLLCGLLSLAACAPIPRSHSTITGDDSGFLGALSFSHQLSKSTIEESTYGIRLDLEGMGGNITQNIPNDQTVRLDDVVLTGPGELDLEFKYRSAILGFYKGKTMGPWEFEGLVGLAHSNLHARGRLGGLTDSADLESTSLYLSGDASYRFGSTTKLYYRLGGMPLVERGEPTIFQTQLGGRWKINQSLTISAGMQGWNYLRKRREGSSGHSGLDLTLSGPFLRLGFLF
jgi:hypothetical protein